MKNGKQLEEKKRHDNYVRLKKLETDGQHLTFAERQIIRIHEKRRAKRIQRSVLK